MSKTPNYDAKVKKILDETKPGERSCVLTGETWLMDDEEVGWYKKFNVPSSHRSPLTRWWCQSAFFLAGQWWWNKHIETGKPILTFVHPATGLRVMPDKEWFQKDFTSEGGEFDLNSSFFKQLRELQLKIPLLAERSIKEPQNSIAAFSLGDVNSYFMMFCRSKNSLFSHWVFDMEDSSEAWNGSSIVNSYNIANSQRIHSCKYVRESFDCINSSFLFDCRNCEFCFGATNKRNAKYIWWNEQLTKEEWERRFSEIDLSCRSSLKEHVSRFHKMIGGAVWPQNFNEKASDSKGEYLTNVENCRYCYSCIDGPKDLYWVNYASGNASDCAFCSGSYSSNNCYYSSNSSDCSNVLFSYTCGSSQRLEYCIQCYNCEDCFGCNGLNYKKFCIFNKQYTEEEYWNKLDEIKCAMLDMGEYGEWFPLSMAPGYFPDSGAPMYFAADETVGFEALGSLEFDPESEGAIGQELSDVTKLKQIDDVPNCVDDLQIEEWAGVPIYDPVLKRRFSYIKPEYQFHKNHKIALSDEHFILRSKKLYQESNSGKFMNTSCHKCNEKVFTSINPTYKERQIYCKSCYLAFIEETN